MKAIKGKVACYRCKYIQYDAVPSGYAEPPQCMHPECFEKDSDIHNDTLMGEIYYSDKRIKDREVLNANLDCKYFVERKR